MVWGELRSGAQNLFELGDARARRRDGPAAQAPSRRSGARLIRSAPRSTGDLRRYVRACRVAVLLRLLGVNGGSFCTDATSRSDETSKSCRHLQDVLFSSCRASLPETSGTSGGRADIQRHISPVSFK